MKQEIVLNVDDNEDDQFLLRRAWKQNGLEFTLHEVLDGDKAIEYLASSFQDEKSFPRPRIILLDLKMLRKSGFEVLDWMRQNLADAPPVAVFSSSQDLSDIQRAYDLGARWYLIKPVEHRERLGVAQLVGQWLENSQDVDLSASPHYRSRP